MSKDDEKVRGIFLSRNFGQHNAITAGLDYARGDWVVVMDCDLQDIPEEIVNLYSAAQQGYDVVVGKRAIRRDGFFKKLGSKLFYAAFKYLADSNVNDRIGNFGIYFILFFTKTPCSSVINPSFTMSSTADLITERPTC